MIVNVNLHMPGLDDSVEAYELARRWLRMPQGFHAKANHAWGWEYCEMWDDDGCDVPEPEDR